MGAKWLSIQESKVKQLQNKTTDRILILNSWIIQAMRNKNVSQFQENIYLYLRSHICTYLCINICACTCTCTCICTHVHVFVCDPPYDVRDKGD